jgi:hypothetical protein
VGAGKRSGIPHLTPALSAPGAEREMLFAWLGHRDAVAQLDIHRCERGLAADQIGRFLDDHDDRCVDVAADQIRHHRSDAQNLELGVDEGRRIQQFDLRLDRGAETEAASSRVPDVSLFFTSLCGGGSRQNPEGR